ncbi:hypothetical protein HNE05_07635 [Aquipseudomonas campi]|uniref:Uncharacterized protein n=1 Tax=Aquipseudomonas campi TaxID=2731681 RepID=A0A6M8F424_9GAMM|nr:hypothetical protein [Pseudomonas campi]QKE63234.1 hypothetical protein HNE05_07635 [Pseudomonas campi]
MTNTTNTKPCKQKLCKNCLQPFQYKRKTAEFCKEYCKKSNKAKRLKAQQEKRLYRAETSAFFYYLADECRRAGTVEVLPATLEDFQALHAVYKYRLKANNYGRDSEYSICHIFPVQHPFLIGTITADNLVVSYSKLNSKYSNTAFAGAGRSISRLSLLPKWRTSEEQPKKEVIKMIVEYLGADFVEKMQQLLKLQPAQRQQVFDWLIAHADERIPSVEKLEALTTQELSKLKALVSGKESGSFAYSDWQEYGAVFGHELRRLVQYRPELERAIEAWEATLEDYIGVELSRHYGKLPKRLTAKLDKVLQTIYAEQFSILHGSPASQFVQKIQTLVSEAKAIAAEPIAQSDMTTKEWADYQHRLIKDQLRKEAAEAHALYVEKRWIETQAAMSLKQAA